MCSDPGQFLSQSKTWQCRTKFKEQGFQDFWKPVVSSLDLCENEYVLPKYNNTFCVLDVCVSLHYVQVVNVSTFCCFHRKIFLRRSIKMRSALPLLSLHSTLIFFTSNWLSECLAAQGHCLAPKSCCCQKHVGMVKMLLPLWKRYHFCCGELDWQ